MEITPNYLELAGGDLVATKEFYATALGFDFIDYGPEYAAVGTDAIGLGFPAGGDLTVPLPGFQTDDLEAALAAVEAAGGEITAPPFDFPGGRRFHFRDPAGNEISIFQNA